MVDVGRLHRDGKQYTATTGEPFVDNVDTSIFFSTVNQVSEKYYTPDGELVYDTNPEVEEAFKVAVDAYEAGISAGIAAWSSGWDPGKAQGAFAVTTAPSWMLSGIKNAAPDTEGLWRVASLPGVGGNWGGSFLAIPARADNPEAAWQYIETMQSPEAQTDHFVRTGTFPAANVALESQEVIDYTDPFYGDSPDRQDHGRLRARSSNSFYNGPDTGADRWRALTRSQTWRWATSKPDDAWQKGLDDARAAIGG